MQANSKQQTANSKQQIATLTKAFILSLALCASTISTARHEDKSNFCCDKPAKKNCDSCINITRKDFRENGKLSKTYVISKPGKYCLCDDIDFEPLTANQDAIIIAADNVFLLLNNKTLSQISSATADNAGITVNPNHKNVTITQGTVTGFTGTGIFIQAGNDTATIENMLISYCGSNTNRRFNDPDFERPFTGGIIALGETANRIQNLTINEVDSLHHTTLFPISPTQGVYSGGANGITVIKTNNVSITNTKAEHLFSNDVAACLFFSRCDNIVIDNVILSDANGDGNANGIDSMANTAGTDRSNGNFQITNVVISDIRVNPGVRTAPAVAGNEAIGVETNAHNFVIKNVFITNVVNPVATAVRAIGFQIATAQNFDVKGRDGLIEDCEVFNITHAGSGTPANIGRAVGFMLETISAATRTIDRVTVKNCEAKNIFASNAVAVAQGFKGRLGLNLVFDTCISEGCSAATPANGAGFVLEGALNSIITNCISGQNGVGILVSSVGATQSTNCLIENNIVSNNSLNGILDTVVGSLNAYYTNHALRNGTNFAGLPAGTPIRTWVVGAAPAPFVDTLDNVSIV